VTGGELLSDDVTLTGDFAGAGERERAGGLPVEALRWLISYRTFAWGSSAAIGPDGFVGKPFGKTGSPVGRTSGGGPVHLPGGGARPEANGHRYSVSSRIHFAIADSVRCVGWPQQIELLAGGFDLGRNDVGSRLPGCCLQIVVLLAGIPRVRGILQVDIGKRKGGGICGPFSAECQTSVEPTVGFSGRGHKVRRERLMRRAASRSARRNVPRAWAIRGAAVARAYISSAVVGLHRATRSEYRHEQMAGPGPQHDNAVI